MPDKKIEDIEVVEKEPLVTEDTAEIDFHYDDKVEVIRGFHAGRVGKATDESRHFILVSFSEIQKKNS